MNKTKTPTAAVILALALTLATAGIATGLIAIQQIWLKAYALKVCPPDYHWDDDTEGCVQN